MTLRFPGAAASWAESARRRRDAIDFTAFTVPGADRPRTGCGRRVWANPRAWEAEATVEGCGDPRLGRLPGAGPQCRVHRDGAESNAAASAGVGVRQGDRIRVTSHRGRAPGVPAPVGERGDRGVSASGDGVEPVAIPICDGV